MSLTPKDLKAAYDRGENISALLRSHSGAMANSEDIIQLSYDLQAGSYVAVQNQDPWREILSRYALAVADHLSSLGSFHSLLDAGVGEATTLLRVLQGMPQKPAVVHGVDISWSRLKIGGEWFVSQGGPADTQFIVATMSHLPYADNSFDVVYTSHAVEPNGGREAELLAELCRVASRYVVLFEPGYELAPPEAQQRMAQHGYCRDLPGHARALGMTVVKHELLSACPNPNNPTAVTIIAKNPDAAQSIPSLVCPQYRTPIFIADDLYYSADSLRAYPVLRGIPCLKPEHAIIASKLTP
ncbi:MAG: class I SAM-dependent methyltransferase [Prosthecobacter sp.]|nr:class I SAM-dependent methyltransferase [Prosthecobacter sp.]